MPSCSRFSNSPVPPPRNSEGKFICTLCNTEKTWKVLSGWQTHMDTHTRPYKCTVPNCKGNAGFATKGVLDRHISRVHQRTRSTSSTSSSHQLPDAPDETETTEAISPQPDQLQVEARNSSTGSDSLQAVSSSMRKCMKATDHGKRKRQTYFYQVDELEDYSDVDGVEGSTKRPKVVGQVSDTGLNRTRGFEDLAAENEKLQKQLDKVNEELERCQKEREKEREMMLGIIDRLTKQ